ncbi:MAG: hypothetical protein IJG88_02170 [Eggerthellaceae bacterium]|nr:hypothetical protein [Eggerthellaceae bacterium]
MRSRDLKWAGLAALAVAASLAVVALGALGTAPAESEASPTASGPNQGGVPPIEVRGASGVAALSDDDGSFAQALSSYLESEGEQARTATVVADPADLRGSSFYVSAGGLWYSCEATGSASGWAVSPLGAQSPVARAGAGDPAPAQTAEPAASGQAPQQEPAQDPPQSGPAAGVEVPVSDEPALSAVIGADAAGRLAEALSAWASGRGMARDAASARVDAGSVRSEPGGVGFVVSCGQARIDVVYSDGAYGFLVLE